MLLSYQVFVKSWSLYRGSIYKDMVTKQGFYLNIHILENLNTVNLTRLYCEVEG